MNVITIYSPRWSTRDVLVAVWKVSKENRIEILAKKKDGTRYYPEPFTISGEQLAKYPIEDRKYGKMYIVPLEDLLEASLEYHVAH